MAEGCGDSDGEPSALGCDGCWVAGRVVAGGEVMSSREMSWTLGACRPGRAALHFGTHIQAAHSNIKPRADAAGAVPESEKHLHVD